MDIKDLVEEIGYEPKRKAACHGGEFCCPCPFCKDGKDRFLIWPNRCNSNGEHQGGRYSCRVCGKYGDAISFLCELKGMTYVEACRILKIEPKEKATSPRLKPTPAPLPIAEDPSKIWQEKATAFVSWCHSQLPRNHMALNSMKQRGFSDESIERFKLGYCPNTFFREREEWGLDPEFKDDGKPKKLWIPAGLVIPTFSKEGEVVRVKIRRTEWKDGDDLPKYVEISGSKRCFSIYGNTTLPLALILESEFDALLVQQEAADLCYCVALGGSTKPLDRDTDNLLRTTLNLLFCPDFDTPGAVALAKWRKVFPDLRRILTPEGKSAGDAFLAGVSLREWIEEEVKSNDRKLR